MSKDVRITVAPGHGSAARTAPTGLPKVSAAGYDVVKMETLRNFDGKPGYSLAQGQ